MDFQLRISIQLMNKLYNFGEEVHKCDAFQEYEKRRTEKCNYEEVQKLNIK